MKTKGDLNITQPEKSVNVCDSLTHESFYLQFCKKDTSLGNNITVYTSIFGGYDGLLPQKRLTGIDYICFADRAVKASPWQVRRVQPDNPDPVRSAKRYKILPHRFFPDHEYSIWIDGNYLVVGKVAEVIGTYLEESPMAVFDHNQTEGDRRSCIYKEFDSIMKQGEREGTFKDDPAVMERQIGRYRSEGYPANNGLIFASVLIRRHNDPDVVKTMEHWWREIEKGSRRDQLSFNYVAWKEKFRYAVIDGNIRDNRWFYQIGAHRPDYRLKLFRYRLRKLFSLKKHR